MLSGSDANVRSNAAYIIYCLYGNVHLKWREVAVMGRRLSVNWWNGMTLGVFSGCWPTPSDTTRRRYTFFPRNKPAVHSRIHNNAILAQQGILHGIFRAAQPVSIFLSSSVYRAAFWKKKLKSTLPLTRLFTIFTAKVDLTTAQIRLELHILCRAIN